MSDDLRFAVLGPIRLYIDRSDGAVLSGRERTLLAMLVLHTPEVVPVERLVDAIWGDQPPRDARNQVQGCVSRLRQRLSRAGAGGQVVVTGPEGYAIKPPSSGVDLLQFRRLVGQARAAVADGDAAQARRRYREALALWRGPALAGVDSALVRQAAAGLDEERVQAWEECLEVELGLGAGGELVPELTELVGQYPYREKLHGALMRALCRAGRPGDALAAYQDLRRLLRDELGVDPGVELQRLHRSILNGGPGLDAPAGSPPPAGRSALVVPRQLPPEAVCFVGREAEQARVRAMLARTEQPERRRPAVIVVYGPGGAGKSALAVRVGHQVVARFPDGQLYVDLFGSTPGMRRLSPAEVLGRFLRSLGTPPAEIPSEEVEAAALFRTLTADRRLLLVLDNAAGREQVAALLPSASGCAVLVTSRQPLATLDADGRLRVDSLPDPEAVALLHGLTVGRTVDPDAAGRIVAHSGGLPLAVRIAAGRLASRPDLPAQEYAARLADDSRRLDELQLDDQTVRDCIRAGYDALLTSGGAAEQLAARAFRALGLLHVPDVAPWVVAAMLDDPRVEAVRTALDRLVDAQLLEPVRNGRYRLHDLVRLVAAERATDEDSPTDRERMLHRAVAFYAGAMWKVERVMRPGRMRPFDLPSMVDDAFLPTFRTVGQMRLWLDEELLSLVSFAEQAASAPTDTTVSVLWLADQLWSQLDIRCDWHTAYRVSELLLDCGERRRDRSATAWGWLLLGRSEACLGRHAASLAALERSLTLLRELGHQLGSALALNALGIVHARFGRAPESISCYQQALQVVRDRDDYTTASILTNVSVSYALLGQLERAEAAGKECVAMAPDSAGHMSAMINLACVQCMRGDHAEAVQLLDQALVVGDEAGDGMRMCESLVIRSEANRLQGKLSAAAVDAGRALSEAEAWGYSFVVATAHRQRARILAAMGRAEEAAHAQALADRAFAHLSDEFRDPLVDFLLGDGEGSWRSQTSHGEVEGPV